MSALDYLQRLEAESIHIFREVIAECEKPVMLYSIGKDSSVMLHLARKAFAPAKPPFPLLQIASGWDFREMLEFRDATAKSLGLELLVHTNEEGERAGVKPWTHGATYSDIMLTQALRQALDKYGFDAAFGGGRRDEEKSRAKERVFSFRSAQHRWDPKHQRPELWSLYNARKNRGESIRVFPLSNWTELDVWQYIHQQQVPIVPLYLAKSRPVVRRDGRLIWVLASVVRGSGPPRADFETTLVDITEQKAADELRSIARLANAAAHEINNPLTMILGRLAMLRDDLTLKAETRERAVQMIAAGERIREIVVDMHRLTRVQLFEHAGRGLPEMIDIRKSAGDPGGAGTPPAA